VIESDRRDNASGPSLLLAAVSIAGAAPLGRLLGVPAWLMVVSGLALLIGGGIEIRFVHRRPMRTYLRLLAAYDSGWVLTASPAF
jgi:hypothetical protein